jgi:hypothetical protein
MPLRELCPSTVVNLDKESATSPVYTERMDKRVLFICGSINQTTQMEQIAANLPDYSCHFTPYYGDTVLGLCCRMGLAEFSVMGKKLSRRCLEYLTSRGLPTDPKGRTWTYDLIITCSDLVIPKNVAGKVTILVQEGMTDPENLLYRLVRRFRFLPRWLASTAATGLSDRYNFFCVASAGYRDLFIRKGVKPDKLVVTGIPNFDNCAKYLDNQFPHRNFVLVCTSDGRETFKADDRKALIRKAVSIAGGRKLIFKLHPNENSRRAASEIARYAPRALVYSSGSAEEMVANCDVLVTEYSSTAYVGLALGKEVHSYFDIEELKALLPIQNRAAASNVAEVCRSLLEGRPAALNSGAVLSGNGAAS